MARSAALASTRSYQTSSVPIAAYLAMWRR